MGRLGNFTRPTEVAQMGRSLTLRVILLGTLVLLAGLVVTSFAVASKVEPVLLSGASNQGKTCADNEGAGQDWVEFKPQPEPPPSGTYSDGVLTVEITYTADKVFSWTSNIGVDAVIAKGGSDGSYLYRYDPPSEATSDTGLTTPGQTGLSHITFCYDRESSITVRKITHPAGDAQSFDFTSNFMGSFSLTHDQSKTSGNLSPGTYSVTETPVEGWDVIAAGCSDGSRADQIELSAGENVTCTIRNKKRGRIIVKKEANPSDTGLSFPFTASWGSFSLAHGQQADSGLLREGTYSVAESVPTGWTLASATCDDGSSPGSIDLNPGETVTCTFVNTRLGRVIVKKIMHGGVGSFTFTGTPSGTISVNNGTISADVAPGQYTSTELPTPGWRILTIFCDDENSESDREDSAIFNVEAGETVTCTFRNKKDSTLIVEKVMEGGQSTFDFSGTPSGSISTSGGTITTSVEEGTYTSTEAAKDGWELVSIVCSDSNSTGNVSTRTATFVAAPGETVRCVFTNRLIPPEKGSITVRKVTVPAGDEQEFDFLFGQTAFALAHGEEEVFDGLDEGSYSVSESTPTGWDLTSATCDNGDDPAEISLGEGDDVICTFTNTKRGTIIVQKQTNPDGAQGSFTFTGDASGSIGDGGQIVVGNLLPGEYEVTESAAAGWLLTSIECSNEGSSGDVGDRTATFDVGPGETVTCVFTNAQQVVGKGSIDVQKSVSPTTLKEPGGSVTYSVRITNTSDVNVSITNVVDDKFGDLDDSGGTGCFDVPINLGPGQFASCQFTKTITGQAGYEHVNTVCADAVDQYGNPLKDCDDAKVTITPRLIDLVIVKEATSPTKLNGTVNYSLTVTNKGPDTATNVVVADPAPAGIQYQSATPSQGTCSVTAAMVTCQLGTIAPGQTVTIAVKGKAIAVGTHVNTATVTGDGGRETNPADNTDSAETVVPAPVTPPVKPNHPPKVEKCAYLVVTPKMIKADGKKDRVVATVRSSSGPMKGVKVTIRGSGIRKSAVTNGKGVVVMVVNPTKPGVITIVAVDKGDPCGARRVGVVGVFLPPLTG